ncbi:hypothetical protein P171DRAFT_44722 [Karstenula rhodostoma CBS 690.94]|uniref:Uncharacterized protein n=1 Tax=Karstenula rhodostoma CBS 690.94 TaxID=1392251 RepID=A0A9P4UC72_9PLEO|nr:hypothetical protein P171DRAFT_44722 [Karstenula rhodostoma CBS 690.94]
MTWLPWLHLRYNLSNTTSVLASTWRIVHATTFLQHDRNGAFVRSLIPFVYHSFPFANIPFSLVRQSSTSRKVRTPSSCECALVI